MAAGAEAPFEKLVPAEGIVQFSRQESPGIVSFGVWSEADRWVQEGGPKRG